MKTDTTTWILLAVAALMLWELNKKSTAATGSLSGGYLPGTAGAAGAAGKSGSSLLQQLLGGGGGGKPSAGISAGGGSGASSNKPATTPMRLPAWLLPPRTPVSLAPNPPLTSMIASVPPPVWENPEMDYPGVTPIATIPSDTSNIFITPDTPPTWENPEINTSTSATFVDDQGNPINIPTDFSSWSDGQISDPTVFNPVDTQTIDTTNLGNISYLPYPNYNQPAIDTSGSGGFSYDDFQSDYSDD